MHAVHASALALALVLAASGCASPAGESLPVEQGPFDVGSIPLSAMPGHKLAPVGVRIEQAERNLDVGRDVAGARAALEAVIADPAATPDQRDQARLSLSRALEAEGDREGAIATVERLLAEHAEDVRFPLAEQAEARLRKLLTGAEGAPRHARPEDARRASAFSRVLAHHFPAPRDPKQALEVRFVAFGGTSEASDRLGTFDVGRALREMKREACALCDDKLSIRLSSSRLSSWVGIPAHRARLANALVVYYFDLGEGRIPARYDAELPLPSAEIAARLARGEGLVAARERPGAPPAILIAAPRDAQLADVEEALSAMNSLPAEPVSVPLKSALKPEEIQPVVRAAFQSFRACYEDVLKHSPTASGRITLKFGIRGDGTVEGVGTEMGEGTLNDPKFERCMTDTTRVLAFPATGRREATTVRYPIVFTPGD